MDRWLISSSGVLQCLVVLGLFSCQTPPEPSPIQDMTIIPHLQQLDSPAIEKLNRLNKLIEGHPQWQESATPLIVGLTADKDFDSRQWDLAQQGWLKILKTESGQLGEWAFQQWLKTYVQILKANATPEVLAKILLAETEGGQASPFLMVQKITDQDILSRRIAATLGTGISIGVASDLVVTAPTAPGRPADDPLLVKTSQNYCLASSPQSWRSWIRTLSAIELSYWQSMIAICRDDEKSLENILPSLAEKLQKSSEFGLAVSAAHRLVDLYRTNGSREGAANAYLLLVAALNRPELTAKHLDLTEFEFRHYHANQVLWGSRYRAMIGDYLTARDWVQRSFQIIDNAYRNDLSQVQRRQLAELRAEGYHILAFRISYEQQDFESALIQTRLGARIESLNEEWRFRLAWYEAWYQYRAGRVKEAHQQWTRVLRQFPKNKDLDRVLFWLSVSAAQEGQAGESRHWYDRLCQDYPLSFYSLVAPRLAKLDGISCKKSQAIIGVARSSGPTRLTQNVDPQDLRRDPELAPLLYRAELAIRADLGELRTRTVEDLYQRLRKQHRPAHNFRSYLYMSRLLYASQDYHRAIGLAYELSLVQASVWLDYPDQLHVYFPSPYLDIFDRNAARFFVDSNVLLALTRRESTFRRAVRSPAGAIGLMQLMPTTAAKYAAKLGQETTGSVVSLLDDPESNIRLGTAYLAELSRLYQGDIPQMLAAYNAGEYVVDRWLAKRTGDLSIVWIEAIPFGETQGYVKNVMRNWEIYRQLTRKD